MKVYPASRVLTFPLLFILYIAPLQDVIATYDLSYMFYADDNQLYIAVNPKETPQVSLDKLRECTQAILHWNTQNMLSTNPGKTGDSLHITVSETTYCS